jgi:hypothetical protein
MAIGYLPPDQSRYRDLVTDRFIVAKIVLEYRVVLGEPLDRLAIWFGGRLEHG